MKKAFCVLLLGTALFLIAGCSSDFSTPAPDPAVLADGSYTGRAFDFPVRVRVRVTLEDGVIRSIDLLSHFNGQGQDGEQIIESVLKAQSLDVDSISGATHSSQTILKAIDNALGKAPARP